MAIPEDSGNETIVRSTIDMAHALGMKVVAEGIETADILHLLRRMNCDVGQGYLFSKPLPANELDEWFVQSEWSGYDTTPPHLNVRTREKAPVN